MDELVYAEVCIACCSLEMMDKMEPPAVADGYGLSVAFVCMLDIVKSIHTSLQPVAESGAVSASGPDDPSSKPPTDVSSSDTGSVNESCCWNTSDDSLYSVFQNQQTCCVTLVCNSGVLVSDLKNIQHMA